MGQRHRGHSQPILMSTSITDDPRRTQQIQGARRDFGLLSRAYRQARQRGHFDQALQIAQRADSMGIAVGRPENDSYLEGAGDLRFQAGMKASRGRIGQLTDEYRMKWKNADGDKATQDRLVREAADQGVPLSDTGRMTLQRNNRSRLDDRFNTTSRAGDPAFASRPGNVDPNFNTGLPPVKPDPGFTQGGAVQTDPGFYQGQINPGNSSVTPLAAPVGAAPLLPPPSGAPSLSGSQQAPGPQQTPSLVRQAQTQRVANLRVPGNGGITDDRARLAATGSAFPPGASPDGSGQPLQNATTVPTNVSGDPMHDRNSPEFRRASTAYQFLQGQPSGPSDAMAEANSRTAAAHDETSAAETRSEASAADLKNYYAQRGTTAEESLDPANVQRTYSLRRGQVQQLQDTNDALLQGDVSRMQGERATEESYDPRVRAVLPAGSARFLPATGNATDPLQSAQFMLRNRRLRSLGR